MLFLRKILLWSCLLKVKGILIFRVPFTINKKFTKSIDIIQRVCYNIIVAGRIFFQNKFHFRISRGKESYMLEHLTREKPKIAGRESMLKIDKIRKRWSAAAVTRRFFQHEDSCGAQHKSLIKYMLGSGSILLPLFFYQNVWKIKFPENIKIFQKLDHFSSKIKKRCIYIC